MPSCPGSSRYRLWSKTVFIQAHPAETGPLTGTVSPCRPRCRPPLKPCSRIPRRRGGGGGGWGEGLVEKGMHTGASGRNWASGGKSVTLARALAATARTLLSDPQTAGGLLVSCAPETADQVLAIFHEGGFGQAALIGRMAGGEPGIVVA